MPAGMSSCGRPAVGVPATVLPVLHQLPTVPSIAAVCAPSTATPTSAPATAGHFRTGAYEVLIDFCDLLAADEKRVCNIR
jgi:hypothetical protein